MAAKSDVFVKMGLVFFIALLSFSIGTFVGKKYSDNQHKLASLEPSRHSAQREVASENHHGEATKTENGMTDDEIAKLAEEFAEDTELTESKAPTPHAETHATEHAAAQPSSHAKVETTAAVKTAPAHKEAQSVAQNLASGKAATNENAKAAGHKLENRLPSSLPKDVAQYSVGKFTVQVASFATENEAKSRAENLKAMGFSSFYLPAEVKGKTWYRVSVGLFATEKEAKEFRVEFMEKSKSDTAIIQKIVQ